MFYKIGVLNNFAEFAWKRRRSVTDKKRLQCKCFPENFPKFLRITASGHFHLLNNLTFFAIQWTNRNQAFYTCEHVLSWLSSVRSAFGKLYETNNL